MPTVSIYLYRGAYVCARKVREHRDPMLRRCLVVLNRYGKCPVCGWRVETLYVHDAFRFEAKFNGVTTEVVGPSGSYWLAILDGEEALAQTAIAARELLADDLRALDDAEKKSTPQHQEHRP